MIRQKLDEYLDDALEPAARAHVEQLLASDPAAATLLERDPVAEHAAGRRGRRAAPPDRARL